MGWADCGTDRDGRPIGYAFEAECDHPECSVQIDRGLSYVCGDMHGEDEYSCGKYFCETHRSRWIPGHIRNIRVCQSCAKLYEEFHNEEETA